MAFNYPWGNLQGLNLTWFINQFKKLREDWATAEAGIDGALDAEIQKAEDALSDVFDARDAAAASATAAGNSASAAALSATAAGNSASSAAASATLANNKATAAGLSEAAAAQSASQAALSATNASNSATQASNSATAAGNSATAAAGSATQAGNSATAAGNSATAAATSETNAAASAQEAEDVLDSIPEDYSALSDHVADLETTSGYIINTVNNARYAIFDANLSMAPKTFQVAVQAVQAGTNAPTPSNPRALTGFSNASVYLTGKNLLKFSRRDGESDTTHAISNLIPYYGKQLYFKNFDEAINGGELNVRYYDANLNELGYLRLTYNIPADVVYTLAPPAGTVWIRFGAYRGDSAGGIAVHLTAQLMVSDDISVYEAFKTACDISFPTEAGIIYNGTIDLIKHKLTVTTAKVTYSSVSGAVEGNGFRLANAYNLPHIKQAYGYMVSNMFLRANSYGHAVSGTGSGANRLGYNSSGQILLNAVVNGAIVTDIATLNSLIATAGGLDIVYEIDNPVEYDLTIADLVIFEGINYVWANTGNINVLEYFIKGVSYIDTLFNNIVAKILPDMKADTALVANDFRIVDNTLYRITTPVASGATLIPNTNCTATTITAVLKSLLA